MVTSWNRQLRFRINGNGELTRAYPLCPIVSSHPSSAKGRGLTHTLPFVFPADQTIMPEALATYQRVLGLGCLG